jgi:arabinofuranosyltransferase
VPPRSSRSRTRSSEGARSAPSHARAPRAVSWRTVAIALGVALLSALTIAHIVRLAFVCDDAFISYRYAGQLAAGHGLVFNPGERVEGYTNFLWVLISAALYRLGLAPEIATLWVSATCAVLALLTGMFSLRTRGASAWWFGLLLAANASFAAWATGGLETALFTLLVFAAFLCVASTIESPRDARDRFDRRLGASALFFLLATLTRPEGLLVGGLSGLFLLARVIGRKLSFGALVRWAALWLIPFAIYFAWRVQYFGHWLPNSFAVKSSGAHLLPAGLAYLSSYANRLGFWLWPVPLVLAALARRSPGARLGTWLLGLTWLVPYLAYVAAVGGDFMDLGRFVVPLLPIAAWLVAPAFDASVRLANGRMARGAALAVTIAVVGWYAALNLAAGRETLEPWHRQVDSIGLLRQYREDWTEVARLIQQISTPSDSIATTAAGIIPYYTGLYTIDQLGLCAADLSGYVSRSHAKMPGHGLIASGALIDRLRPQFLLGHPVVVDSVDKVHASLMLEPRWTERISRNYRVVGGQVSLEPPRYFVLGVRLDVMERRQAQPFRSPAGAP